MRTTTNQAIDVLHDVYHSCNAVFDKPIHDAYLYGSYARGDYNEESDIDIFLTVDAAPEELPQYRRAISHIRGQLSLKYDRLVSIKVNSLSQFRQYKNILPYYQSILQEGIRYAE